MNDKACTQVGASIHQIGSLFGPGMDNTAAGTMVREWGCNNIVVGKARKICVLNYPCLPGGDLTLFISGLKQSVQQIKELAGEETGGQSMAVAGVVA